MPSGSSREEHNHVKEVLDNVLDVSQTVHQETTKTTDLMNQLVQTTESVANSMQEISSATNMTATSIEEQSQMTRYDSECYRADRSYLRADGADRRRF